MPALSGKFNCQDGVIWKVGFVSINQEVPNTPDRLHICDALVDTGADSSCISIEVARQLQLQPSGKTDMYSASEIAEVNVYDVHPALVLPAMPDSEGNMQSEIFLFNLVTAPEFNSHGGKYTALIGRDVLCQGVFSMSFDGHFTFAF